MTLREICPQQWGNVLVRVLRTKFGGRRDPEQIYTLLTFDDPCLTLDPSNVWRSSQEFFRPILVATEHSLVIILTSGWPRITIAWPSIPAMCYARVGDFFLERIFKADWPLDDIQPLMWLLRKAGHTPWEFVLYHPTEFQLYTLEHCGMHSRTDWLTDKVVLFLLV